MPGGFRARLLEPRIWPVPGRRMVSVSPEVSLDVAKRFFMENLPVLEQLNFPRWRWLFKNTVFYHCSRRTFADDCWTMIKDAKSLTPSDAEETGDTSLCGAHKDSRHWTFQCRREPHEAAQFLRRSLRLWHRSACGDTPFETSVT